jgi:hypothetical protein
MPIVWNQTFDLPPKSYVCGFCSNRVSSSKGFAGGGVACTIYICPHCSSPTYWLGDKRIPDVAPGGIVTNVPQSVDALYREARDAYSASAHTASVLACRKVLMNIGVDQGAKAGLSFLEYVDYLAAKGHLPANGRGWVDHIRQQGNEATHEIRLMTSAESGLLIIFVEMLLKVIYEFPSLVPTAPPAP